jgi:hypothetical protein
MAIRSLREIWVDANFKETQLRDLRIGQPADLYVDMYGGRPPQNATGNFVKVVQRLPVRIELQNYDPDKDPLFIGLSVVPSEQSQAFLLQQTGDPALSQELAWQALESLRQQQASSLAYFDCFWIFAVIMLVLVPVVLLMKRSVTEKGARVGVE